MEKAIVYVRTDFWGAMAVQDLLAQEKRCLAYAEANGLKVAKVFRELPWKRKKGTQILEAQKYVEQNAGKIDTLIVYRPRNLARFKPDFISRIAGFRSLGLKVSIVIYQNKSKV